MRNALLIFACCCMYAVHGQSKLSVGQYAYIRDGRPFYVSPIAQYTTRHGWYAEARYNYEEQQTFSLYAGHSFSADKNCSWVVTPMAGIMAGKLQGGSAGVNAELDYGKMYLSTQSQYSVSWHDRTDNFFFSWSEAGYRVAGWLFAGLSLQYTKPYRSMALVQPGMFECLSFNGWSFPVYCFLPPHSPSFFVVGITREWKYTKTGHSSPSRPPFPERSKGASY